MVEEGEPRETCSEDSQTPNQLSRIEAARAGHLPLRELTHDELAAFNTAVNEAIERRLAIIDWQGMLSRRGLYSVSLDDDGRIVVRPPDGAVPEACPNPGGQEPMGGEV